MGEETAIQWTDHTFNPWWGCAKVSPGCTNCYAERDAKRFGRGEWGPKGERHTFGAKHWAQPLAWDRAAARARRPDLVFCASMADVFEDRRDLDVERAKLWKLIDDTPNLIWQLLTKRPENIASMIPWRQNDGVGLRVPRNVWLGTTVEDQKRADERIPILCSLPGLHFLSCEPLLERVDLRPWLSDPCNCWGPAQDGAGQHSPKCATFRRPWGIDWVIVGGESGNGARPFDLGWAREIVGACKSLRVPVFVKQLGAQPIAGSWDIDAKWLARISDRKGGRLEEIPPDLRVREMPIEARRC